jgi:RHS repeat-associated protein
VESYAYDGLGQRVDKNGPGGTTVFVYDALGQLAAEYSSTGPVLQEYVRLGSQLEAIENASGTPCRICYLTYDHLGSTRLVTDQNANVVARHDFRPFGEEISGNTAGRGGQWGVSDGVNQKFSGKERDSETGLDYFGARYYGSSLGRFTSPDLPRVDQDPSDPQSWNLYSYVRNNPLANIDPNGMDCITFDNGSQGLDPDHPECGCGSLDQNGNDSQPQQVNVNSNGNVTWGGDDSLSPFATAASVAFTSGEESSPSRDSGPATLALLSWGAVPLPMDWHLPHWGPG